MVNSCFNAKPGIHHPLESHIQYSFRNRELMLTALTHRSHGPIHNEQLEWLGDSVLQMIVSTRIFGLWPYGDVDEGTMVEFRSTHVANKHLADVARELDLGSHLILGRSEEMSGGRTKDSLLANAVEALIAAIYLDGGFDAAKRFVNKFV